jgi:hypothetical protein
LEAKLRLRWKLELKQRRPLLDLREESREPFAAVVEVVDRVVGGGWRRRSWRLLDD